LTGDVGAARLIGPCQLEDPSHDPTGAPVMLELYVRARISSRTLSMWSDDGGPMRICP
jgi:hypothetical protein